MGRNQSVWLTATLTLVSFAVPAFAQQISEARVQELIKQAAVNVSAAQATQSAQPAGAATVPTIRLSIDDAVKAALDHNLDIVIGRLNPGIQDISYASLRSVYLPALTSQFSAQSQNNAATTTVAGGNSAGAAIGTTTDIFNGGVAQAVPFGGGSFAVTINNTRSTTTSLNTLYSTQYAPIWSGSYTQPLLKGFKIDANRQGIYVQKINRDITDVQLKATITNTVSNVREAYWNYVFAVQSVQVDQQLVDLAQQLVQDNQTRVQVGTMAKLDVVTAQAQAAAQQQVLVTAQGTLRTNELALKRLLVAGTQDPLWNAHIDPADRPDFMPEPIDLEAAVRTALANRTDLQIAKKNLDINGITLNYLSNQLLPQTDLVATYGWAGIGGTELVKNATSGAGTTNQVQSIPGGYSDALQSLFHNQLPRWNLTLNMSYPLGLNSAKATTARARIQLNQDQAQVKQIELQVATDITNAVINVQNGAERVQAAQVARDLAQQQLDAENAKFQVGMSTNYLVVQAQNNLATAQNTELQNILNYRTALVELDRLQQTTLTSQNITLLSNSLK